MILVTVTTVDDDTGLVESTLIERIDEQYGWAIEKAFRDVAERVIKRIDPKYLED